MHVNASLLLNQVALNVPRLWTGETGTDNGTPSSRDPPKTQRLIQALQNLKSFVMRT